MSISICLIRCGSATQHLDYALSFSEKSRYTSHDRLGLHWIFFGYSPTPHRPRAAREYIVEPGKQPCDRQCGLPVVFCTTQWSLRNKVQTTIEVTTIHLRYTRKVDIYSFYWKEKHCEQTWVRLIFFDSIQLRLRKFWFRLKRWLTMASNNWFKSTHDL